MKILASVNDNAITERYYALVHWMISMPIALYLEKLISTPSSSQIFRNTVKIMLPFAFLVLLSVGFTSSMYAPNALFVNGLKVKRDHPMFTELSMIKDFNIIVSSEEMSFWPEVFDMARITGRSELRE